MSQDDAPQRFRRGISWLCWAYNEEELIDPYLRRAYAMCQLFCEDFEIVVVDDCSTDRTNAIVQELQEEMPEIRLFRNETNLNVGLSSRRAIQSASKEFLFWQTIDWSYDISQLPRFLALLEEYDIVAGVRRDPVTVKGWLARPLAGVYKLIGIEHITRRSDTVPKAIISIVNYMLVRTLFGVPLSDYQNVVFYRTEAIQKIDYEAMSSFANPEGLIKSHWLGYSIVEVPISFIPREVGEAKGTRSAAILAAIWDILRIWFKTVVLRRRNYTRPGEIRRLVPEEWAS